MRKKADSKQAKANKILRASAVAAVLGHSNVNTTMECYIIKDPEETQAVHGKCAG